jgi:hypothetical protein
LPADSGTAGKRFADNKSAERNTGKEGIKNLLAWRNNKVLDTMVGEGKRYVIADDEISSYC